MTDAPNEDLDSAIASALNRHCAENGSNTPDFILSEFLRSCLAAFNAGTRRREDWYGVHCIPGQDHTCGVNATALRAQVDALTAERDALLEGADEGVRVYRRQWHREIDRRDAAEAERDRLREALQTAEVALQRCFDWVPDVSEFEGEEQEEHLAKTHEWTNRALRMTSAALAPSEAGKGDGSNG